MTALPKSLPLILSELRTATEGATLGGQSLRNGLYSRLGVDEHHVDLADVARFPGVPV